MSTEDQEMLSEEEEEDEEESGIQSPSWTQTDGPPQHKVFSPGMVASREALEAIEVMPEIMNEDNGLPSQEEELMQNSHLRENSQPIIMDASDEWTDDRLR